MKIDIFAHIFPKPYFDKMVSIAPDGKDMYKRVQAIPSIIDLDERFCETHPDAHPGPYVMLSVSDTGSGMDADTMAHAFEPFYTTKPPGEGTGLGLSTVYGVVAQSGGCTYVRSEPGKGTTFTIYLPRVDAHVASREAPPAAGTSEPLIIMVAGDDHTYLSLTKRILERRGYKVLAVTDADRAAALLDDANVTVDALLLDVLLPGSMQGSEVAALASARRPGLPVLFMSTYPREMMVREGKIDGQAAYLEKPFTAEELTSRVRTCLARPEPDGHPAELHRLP